MDGDRCHGEARGLRFNGRGGTVNGFARAYGRFSLASSSGARMTNQRPHSPRTPARSRPFQPRPAHIAPSLSENGRAVLSTVDRKSTRLNSSHMSISYAVFCLKKKKI